jgi:hypothetical protein
MIWKYTKLILAVCGLPLGLYLFVLAFSTKLGDSSMNNFVAILGFIIFSGFGTYLMVKGIKRLNK